MGVTENELYDAVMRDLVDLQRKKGHIPFWGSLGNREEDQDVAEIEVTRCWAKEMNKRGWQIDLDTIRPDPKGPPRLLSRAGRGEDDRRRSEHVGSSTSEALLEASTE